MFERCLACFGGRLYEQVLDYTTRPGLTAIGGAIRSMLVISIMPIRLCFDLRLETTQSNTGIADSTRAKRKRGHAVGQRNWKALRPLADYAIKDLFDMGVYSERNAAGQDFELKHSNYHISNRAALLDCWE